MAPEFSVVIPTFRRPLPLGEAMKSVLDQQGVDLELIVVDDSPERSARAVVEGFQDSRIIYVENPEPTGGRPSIVRNLGLARACGRYVHFLDDDDITPAGHYRDVGEVFRREPRVGIVFGRIEPFGQGPADQLEREKKYFAAAAAKAALCQRFGRRLAFTAEMLFGEALLVCSAGVSRRECAERIGGFDPNIRLMEDADYNMRMMRNFGARFLDRTTLHYRISSPSLMHDPNPDPAQIAEVRKGRNLYRAKYRAEHGSLEYFALALFARSALKYGAGAQ